MSTDVALEQMSFDPPGPGSWTFDGAHVPRPWSRYQAEIHPPCMVEGMREGARRYGLLFDTLQYRPVNGFARSAAPFGEFPGGGGQGGAGAHRWHRGAASRCGTADSRPAGSLAFA